MQGKSKRFKVILGIFIIFLLCFIIKPYVSEAGTACSQCGGKTSVVGSACNRYCADCGARYGSCSYTGRCSAAHCGASVCSGCGAHKGSCGGGHTYTNCSHCGIQYCTKCTSHPCPCNSSGRCSDRHCSGMTWCTICGSHSHRGCNSNARCSKVHCGKSMCSVCGAHYCTGGHKFVWVTDNTSSETQTHTYKCSVSGCTATNGSHTATWAGADATHKSKCKSCNLTYTHAATWSTAQRNATEPHPCAWWGGCAATHTATWGSYYKVNGGKDADNDGGPHTRECSTCGITEKYHSYSTESWNWYDTENHIRACKTCGLRQTLAHNFTEFGKKDIDATTHKELYKHWKLCPTCDVEHKEVDELHVDNGNGICAKCGQILWKILSMDASGNGEDITEATLDEENATEAFRKAKREEVIKIIEVVDNNGNPKIQYIKEITGTETIEANSNNELTITKNGEYKFETAAGGTGKFVIDNISREILVDKILNPVTSTPEDVVITVRTNKSEEKFNKDIYIKEGRTQISNAELSNGDNPYKIEKTVDKNGTYYFTAKDTAGNVREIAVVVDNIIRGQASVAISNDVFINGYVFTEILVNPNKEWNLTGNTGNIVTAKAYKVGDTEGKELADKNVKIVKVMDMQRENVNMQGNYYLPGMYYVQVAVGGDVFSEKGTYVVDLESMYLPSKSGKVELDGMNRIIVEVQDLKDLT